MDETFDLIQQLSSERFNLYRQAGKEHLTNDQMARIHSLTDRLAVLWDQHRRELASLHRAKPLKDIYPEAA